MLVVEDDAVSADVLATMGSKLGHQVAVARDGDEAINMLTGTEYDVVLLDVHLPKRDGRDVMRCIKRENLSPNAVIIFVTASAMQTDRVMGLELGADDYEAKPIHARSLFRKISYLVEKKRAVQPRVTF
jgi:DNA-binding response OmpR family regulator